MKRKVNKTKRKITKHNIIFAFLFHFHLFRNDQSLHKYDVKEEKKKLSNLNRIVCRRTRRLCSTTASNCSSATFLLKIHKEKET